MYDYDVAPASINPVGFGQGAGMPQPNTGHSMTDFFHYVLGKVFGTVGTGANDMALIQPQNKPVDSAYTPGPLGNVVMSDLGPTRPAYAKLGQDFVPVDLMGDGAYFHGTTVFSALSDGGTINPAGPGNG